MSEVVDFPLISIIVPCYNQGEYLNESLSSIESQTYENWECLIINDGSTDNSANIAEAWCKKDQRFICCEKKNGGLSSARNVGLDRARGKYIQFLDADDVIERGKLELSVQELAKDDNLRVVISNFEGALKVMSQRMPPYCDLSVVKFSLRTIVLNWDRGFTIPIHCGVFHFDFFKSFRFNETLMALEDWDFWIRLFKESESYAFIDMPLAIYRQHNAGMSKNFGKMYRAKRAFLQHIKSQKVIEGDLLSEFEATMKNYWLPILRIKYLEERYPKIKHYFELKKSIRLKLKLLWKES
ncbi:MAG: glycosyltransferase family 2 protein [Imperialibacter sp.]|uniref:glycosyltransferase family 2 protein n=1 Tax=Imperialibacter sp. TaxID=2038411 RepID=UPI0032EAFE26